MALFGRKAAAAAAGGGTTVATPFGERTREQVEATLEAARIAREEKSALLAKVRSGELTLADIFSDAFKHNERVQKLQLGSALRATPGISAYRAGKLMDAAGIDRKRRIRGTGARQREKLLQLVDSMKQT